MKYLVGIDVRTNGVDCLLMDEGSRCVNAKAVPYSSVAPEAGWLEQDPEEWWQATCRAIHDVIEPISPEDIAGIGLCGELHGLVPLTEDNEVVRNAILFTDQRVAAEYEYIFEEEVLPETQMRTAGFMPAFAQAELRWLKENEPDSFGRIAKLLLPKDYIRYMLTGVISTTEGDATASGYFTTEDKEWNSEIVSNIGYNIVAFPPVSASNAPCGTVTALAAAQTGLRTDTPVYGASEEEVLKSTGMNLIQPGVLGIVAGGSGIVATQTDDIPRTADGRLESTQNADGTRNMLYGIQRSCGDSIRWAENALFEDEADPAEALERSAERAPIGSHGVIFLPYLMGERSPHIEPGAKAVFYGLSVMVRSKDLARSVIEGIVFGLHEIYELMQKENRKIEIGEIVMSGELCAYPLVKQVIADVFDRPVKLYDGASMGSAYGAALIAGVGEGVFANMQVAEDIRQVEEIIEPIDGNHNKYSKSMETYKELYADLHKTFKKAQESARRHHGE